MTGRNFPLQPFPGEPGPAGLRLVAAVCRQHGLLRLRYVLAGPLDAVSIPPPAAAPARRWLLWEDTCFECFLAVPGAPGYWEVNLSPAGHWNVFRLTGYRTGICEEPAFDSLDLGVTRQPGELTLEVQLEVGRIVARGQALEAGLTAVIRLADGSLTHWALAHPGPAPDFHRRESFLIRWKTGAGRPA